MKYFEYKVEGGGMRELRRSEDKGGEERGMEEGGEIREGRGGSYVI